MKRKNTHLHKAAENLDRQIKKATSNFEGRNEEESIVCRKCQENEKEKAVEKEKNELAEALKDIAKIKEDLEQLRREMRAEHKDARKSRKRTRKVGKETLRPQSRFWEGFATDMAFSDWDTYELLKKDFKRKDNDTDGQGDESDSSGTNGNCREVVCDAVTENAIIWKQGWKWKNNRKLKSQAKRDDSVLEKFQQELLKDSQELSRSEETAEEEDDIDILKNEIEEIIKEKKAQKHSRKKWEKKARESVIREREERKADKKAEEEVRKQQLIFRKREEKERKAQRKAEKKWISWLKRNIIAGHKERRNQRRAERRNRLRHLIELVEHERQVMKAKKKADLEWRKKAIISLLLHEYQLRKDERIWKKQARRAFKQEEQEKEAQMWAEGERVKNELRSKIGREHKKRKAQRKHKERKRRQALNELKQRKKDLDRQRKPKRSWHANALDYALLLLKEPKLITLYLRRGAKQSVTNQSDQKEGKMQRWNVWKSKIKARVDDKRKWKVHSQDEVWGVALKAGGLKAVGGLPEVPWPWNADWTLKWIYAGSARELSGPPDFGASKVSELPSLQSAFQIKGASSSLPTAYGPPALGASRIMNFQQYPNCF
ncbi:golgin subfamily A member 6-like protein 22 [Macrobrachium rosenbergii]|uniref:golgin subfamily A member 6-like protein 22 n=1 Tax=Macrobrachium rosenbergii TaxID=79674 RepID=UPI0034D4F881